MKESIASDDRRQPSLRLRQFEGEYAIVRLAPNEPFPAWLPTSGFVGITRTSDELSIITSDSSIPQLPDVVRGYVGFVVEGPLPFDAVGILASLAGPLAAAGIPILAISTYNTDYLFVPVGRIEAAIAALTDAGHTISGQPVRDA
jgi:uncharacterized protein